MANNSLVEDSVIDLDELEFLDDHISDIQAPPQSTVTEIDFDFNDNPGFLPIPMEENKEIESLMKDLPSQSRDEGRPFTMSPTHSVHFVGFQKKMEIPPRRFLTPEPKPRNQDLLNFLTENRIRNRLENSFSLIRKEFSSNLASNLRKQLIQLTDLKEYTNNMTQDIENLIIFHNGTEIETNLKENVKQLVSSGLKQISEVIKDHKKLEDTYKTQLQEEMSLTNIEFERSRQIHKEFMEEIIFEIESEHRSLKKLNDSCQSTQKRLEFKLRDHELRVSELENRLKNINVNKEASRKAENCLFARLLESGGQAERQDFLVKANSKIQKLSETLKDVDSKDFMASIIRACQLLHFNLVESRKETSSPALVLEQQFSYNPTLVDTQNRIQRVWEGRNKSLSSILASEIA